MSPGICEKIRESCFVVPNDMLKLERVAVDQKIVNNLGPEGGRTDIFGQASLLRKSPFRSRDI